MPSGQGSRYRGVWPVWLGLFPFLLYVPFALYFLILYDFEIRGTDLNVYFQTFAPIERVLHGVIPYYEWTAAWLVEHGYLHRVPIIFHAISLMLVYLIVVSMVWLGFIFNDLYRFRRYHFRFQRFILASSHPFRLAWILTLGFMLFDSSAWTFATVPLLRVQGSGGRLSSTAHLWTPGLMWDGLVVVSVLSFVYLSPTLLSHLFFLFRARPWFRFDQPETVEEANR